MQIDWPDKLSKPNRDDVAGLLTSFWLQLAKLPDLLARGELLLCADLTNDLRTDVRDMMLALNGIAFPEETRHLNTYLGESQRRALEKTLALPSVDGDSLIGQCVAFVVMYRWYAPQLVAAYDVEYPSEAEDDAWRHLISRLPEWPRTVTTELTET